MNAQSNQPNHPLIVFSLALIAIIIIGGAITFIKPPNTTQTTQSPAQLKNAITYQKETVPRNQIISSVNKSDFAYAQGPEDAIVTVAEYFDFMCPFSAQSAQTMNRLLLSYKTSPVKFVFHQVPAANIYPASLGASNASLCAKEQGKFLQMYSLLFEQQRRINKDDFSSFTDALNLDRSAFDTCMSRGKYQKWISKDLSDAVTLKLTGTPTWFINGRRYTGAMPFDVLAQAINNELAAVSTLPK